MEGRKPLILISNDDGYQAKGLRFLIERARRHGDVVVVAPEKGRSGESLSFTSALPLRARIVEQEEGLTVVTCSGTPCDCVKLAYSEFLGNRRPDLLLAGVNHGDNASVNAHYSGTIGVAIEGTLKAIPSVAFSSMKTAADADFTPLEPFVDRLIGIALEKGLPQGVFLNVNFPDSDSFKGIRVCRMGQGEWVNEISKQIDPRGRMCYWVVGQFVDKDADQPETDLSALRDGYVTITPLQLDMTAYAALDDLSKLLTP